jgi:4-carboxymuconolactone decarboxylase
MATLRADQPPARIAEIAADAQHSDAVREVLGIFEAGANNPVVKTFAQHPPLAIPFLTFNRYLLRGSSLPVRWRQIAILQVAWTRKARYMWASHLRTSLRLGLAPDDFAAIRQGPDSAHWSDPERLILQAVDELRDTSMLRDASWAALRRHLDETQLLDFLFTVGTYLSLAMVFNTLRIEREPELLELAQRHGSPDLAD